MEITEELACMVDEVLANQLLIIHGLVHLNGVVRDIQAAQDLILMDQGFKEGYLENDSGVYELDEGGQLVEVDYDTFDFQSDYYIIMDFDLLPADEGAI